MEGVNKAIRFFFAIIVCQLTGLIGSFFTGPAITTWYAGLAKPSFTPPNWLFAPVWISLYFLMGIALYIIIREDCKEKKIKNALYIFAIQLVLNASWSIIFFGLNTIFIALIEITILWIAILLTIIFFYKISKTASILLLPYLAWVSFAVALNFSIWQLN